jgi:hypothetical protein
MCPVWCIDLTLKTYNCYYIGRSLLSCPLGVSSRWAASDQIPNSAHSFYFLITDWSVFLYCLGSEWKQDYYSYFSVPIPLLLLFQCSHSTVTHSSVFPFHCYSYFSIPIPLLLLFQCSHSTVTHSSVFPFHCYSYFSVPIPLLLLFQCSCSTVTFYFSAPIPLLLLLQCFHSISQATVLATRLIYVIWT